MHTLDGVPALRQVLYLEDNDINVLLMPVLFERRPDLRCWIHGPGGKGEPTWQKRVTRCTDGDTEARGGQAHIATRRGSPDTGDRYGMVNDLPHTPLGNGVLRSALSRRCLFMLQLDSVWNPIGCHEAQ